MYDFSGIWYRIIVVDGLIFMLGVILILFEKPWAATFSIRNCKDSFVLILLAVVCSAVLISRILHPNINTYTGEFIEEHHARSGGPFNNTFTFWNGTGKRPSFRLDTFSKKKIFFDDLKPGNTYVVYYDTLTNVIVKVEEID